ncbi:uncharacterized protein LOC125561773 [Nematostella vectensis]|uniref:uncharacterized protein LOC125561773 n=1 Tax=Nematostella vectensis TaxID=45351 RepID=UPI0020777F33|nr:uncharacterized protein LOC125561773 [Nematostella vectensis]
MSGSTVCLLFLVATLYTIASSQVLLKRPAACSRILKNPCVIDEECCCSGENNRMPIICNTEKQCDHMTFADYLMRKQACPDVFKRRCSSNSECVCTQAKYICENGECVRAKKTFQFPFSKSSDYFLSSLLVMTSLGVVCLFSFVWLKACECAILTRAYIPECSEIHRSPCGSHRDCKCTSGGYPGLYICSPRGRCSKMTISFLTSLLPCPGVHKKRCQTDDDCPCESAALKCEENECVRKYRSRLPLRRSLQIQGVKYHTSRNRRHHHHRSRQHPTRHA